MELARHKGDVGDLAAFAAGNIQGGVLDEDYLAENWTTVIYAARDECSHCTRGQGKYVSQSEGFQCPKAQGSVPLLGLIKALPIPLSDALVPVAPAFVQQNIILAQGHRIAPRGLRENLWLISTSNADRTALSV